MDELRPGDPRSVGRYSLTARLGAGGMGQVFLGSSPGGRPVAVKLVHAGFAADAEFRRRFKREVEAARQVGGFHTAQVVDADPDADTPWLVTAYVPGPSLASAIVEHGPFPPASTLVLGAGLAEALEAIHRVGVVHRDLKPSNVLLAADGPRVIDFGIARAIDASGVTRGAGTPGFMAPELIADGLITPACDVFAFGAVLAFAVGVRPFGEGPSEALTYRIVHKEPDLTGLPDALAAIVASCLDKDPEARPAPAALLDALTVGGDDAWLPLPVQEMITRYPTGRVSVPSSPATSAPPTPVPVPPPAPPPPPSVAPTTASTVTSTQSLGLPPQQGHPSGVPMAVRFGASNAPVVIALAGTCIRFLVGVLVALLSFGIIAGGMSTTADLDDSGANGATVVSFVLLGIGLIMTVKAIAWLFSHVSAVRRPCELHIGQAGLELSYSGRTVLYRWHEIGRVVVRRRAEDGKGWAICVFPIPGTALPLSRSARTPLCYLERKTGWIVVVPVRRLNAPRRDIEMTLARYAGPHWGGNA